MAVGEKTHGFKRATICNHLENKLEEWLLSLPKDLQEKIRDKIFVTGGAITSMLLGEIPNDYDIYFTDTKAAAAVAEYYINQVATNHIKVKTKIEKVSDFVDRVKILIKSAGILSSDIDQSDYRYFEQFGPEEIKKYFKNYGKNTTNSNLVLNITSNAITLNNGIQIILCFVGNSFDVHEYFDFAHTKNIYILPNKFDKNNDNLFLSACALECTLSKTLMYQGSMYPVAALFRIRKFIERGWNITAGEMFKIAYDISKLDLDNYDVLQEQLIGVDTAYFLEMIAKLKKTKNAGTIIDRLYIFTLINTIFR